MVLLPTLSVRATNNRCTGFEDVFVPLCPAQISYNSIGTYMQNEYVAALLTLSSHAHSLESNTNVSHLPEMAPPSWVSGFYGATSREFRWIHRSTVLWSIVVQKRSPGRNLQWMSAKRDDRCRLQSCKVSRMSFCHPTSSYCLVPD